MGSREYGDRYSATENAWITDAHVRGVDYFTGDDWNCFEQGTRMANFALLGVGGFVAPRHLAAIRDTGNRLIAACDPHDSRRAIPTTPWE
jgi:hypothetical protein